jgi:hypothetical protein
MKGIHYLLIALGFTGIFAIGASTPIGSTRVTEGLSSMMNSQGKFTKIQFADGTTQSTSLSSADADQILAPDGTQALPGISFKNDTDNGFWLESANSFRIVTAGVGQWQVFASQITGDNSASLALQSINTSSTTPNINPNKSDLNTGIGQNAADEVSLIAGGVEGVRMDTNATAGNTRFMLYDVDNATLERVSVGASDSGGVGFKVLRIPN